MHPQAHSRRPLAALPDRASSAITPEKPATPLIRKPVRGGVDSVTTIKLPPRRLTRRRVRIPASQGGTFFPFLQAQPALYPRYRRLRRPSHSVLCSIRQTSDPEPEAGLPPPDSRSETSFGAPRESQRASQMLLLDPSVWGPFGEIQSSLDRRVRR